MKKVVRTVWISLLSGLAFLVACTSSKGLTRAERKQLKAERTDLINQINQQSAYSSNDPKVLYEIKQNEIGMRQRLNEIDQQLGNEEAIVENNAKMGIVYSEMDSLVKVINAEVGPCVYGPPTTDRRAELQNRLDQLLQAIQKRESSCVYGSPEIIQRYGEETRRMRQEADSIQQEINKLDNE